MSKRHLFVCCGVDEDVTVADSRLDDRHLAVADHVVDQACAAARNQHIDQSARRHQLIGDLARTRHELDGLGRESGIDQPGLERLDHGRVRLSSRGRRPRSRAALPDFRQMPPASAVTLGRAS